MNIWRAGDGRENASHHTLNILDDIERDLSAFPEPRPVVASIRVGAGLNDGHDFEVEIPRRSKTKVARLPGWPSTGRVSAKRLGSAISPICSTTPA